MFKKELVLAAIVIVPLFQTAGYNRYMGIIDPSITYFFFYAVPLAFLLLFFLLFYWQANHNVTMPLAIKLLLPIYIIMLSLNGPLIPGTVLIACPLIMIAYSRRYFPETNQPGFFRKFFNSLKKIPSHTLLLFVFFCLVCIYSLYIGTFNAENDGNLLSIHDRYIRMQAGLYYLLTQKAGFALLTTMILLNTFLIKRIASAEAKKIIVLLKWIAVFCIIYVALLPLGGYRSYRPNIIRYDSIMPVTICMIFMYGCSTYFLLKHLTENTLYKKVYVLGIIFCSLVFTYADKPVTEKNSCERAALEKIAQSKESIVHLTEDCTIMAWEKITDYNDSKANAVLLKYWGVTKEKKLYYQD